MTENENKICNEINFFDLSKKEKIKITIKLYLIFFAITCIFYRNIYLAMIMSMSFLIVYREQENEKIEKERENFINEFKDFTNIFATATITGDEPYTALNYAYKELVQMVDKRSKLAPKILEVINKCRVDMNLGIAFIELAEEVKIKEVERFANLINVALKSSGNISEILLETSNIITQRIEMNSEIKKMFYEKKYELKIILSVPILIYCFLSITAIEYILPIYSSISGYIAITIALVLLLIAYIAGNKIMEMKIEL